MISHKPLPLARGSTNQQFKPIFRAIYAMVAALVLGTGMCMCLVWQQIVWDTRIGLLGMIVLIALIPMVKGIK